MWLELVYPKPGSNQINSSTVHSSIWINFEHVVRVEFLQESNILVATVITTKPGGSDRSVYKGEDAEVIRDFFKKNMSQIDCRISCENT